MLKKAFAIAVSGGMLLFQAAEVVSPTDGWYWPFMDYPMYSVPNYEGDTYFEYGLRLAPCDPGQPPRAMDFGAMGIQYFDFRTLLVEAAVVNDRWEIREETTAQARRFLGRRAVRRAGPGYCRAEIQVKRHVIREGVGYREPTWETARTWELPTPVEEPPEEPVP